MLKIEELTVDRAHDAYQNGEFTSRQLVEAYFEQIKAIDKAGPSLNALNAHSETAIEEADALDNYFAMEGKFVGPLHGIPVIVKDQCDTVGIETTYGNVCCKHVPTKDATLVRKLKEAGAIVLAKSTMPVSIKLTLIADFAASFNSASSVSGETLNPYDVTRDSGGSSAGTGTAIAANYGILGVGEDTGGSIRVPASFCNLVGLRPTLGLVSRTGLSPLVKTQDTPGPMARTVRDAALMLDVLVGFDPEDPYTAAAAIAGLPKGGSYASNLSKKVLSGARIGVLHSVFGNDNDPECAAVNKVIRHTLSKFAHGTTLIDVEVPSLQHFRKFTPTYSSRSLFDINNFLATRPQLNITGQEIYAIRAFHPSLPLFKELATGYSDPYQDPLYVQRLDERDTFQRVVMGVMIEKNLDAITFPSVQIPAPTIDATVSSRFETGFPTNTDIASQLHMPAISVPVGFTEDRGLPVGLELLGMPYSEQLLLELAYGVEVLTKARRTPLFE